MGRMAERKKQFYAVLKGHRPGIYTQWTGSDGAEAQVKGFPGAVFRGFASRAEAQSFMNSGGQVIPPPLIPNEPRSRSVSQPLPAATDHQAELDAGKVVIFTDGASTGNPGPGGYGVVMLHGASRKELSGGYSCTTNNRMELMGVITGLRSIKRKLPIIIYSDSQYVVRAVEQGWARRWRSRGWMRTADERAENADLWAELLDLLDSHDVTFRWVKGHASNPENERCDRLAVGAAHRKDLPPDPGYPCK